MAFLRLPKIPVVVGQRNSAAIAATLVPQAAPSIDSLPQRYTLAGQQQNGLFEAGMRLPARCIALRVISGCAWISYKDEDVFLHAGETFTFKGDSHKAVISSISTMTLIFDLHQ